VEEWYLEIQMRKKGEVKSYKAIHGMRVKEYENRNIGWRRTVQNKRGIHMIDMNRRTHMFKMEGLKDEDQ
jgi:hypothetical protein